MTALAEIYGQSFMRDALCAAVLSGAMLAYLGLFIVLRRTVFLGAALPQLAALGAAGAMVAGIPPTGGALAGTILGGAARSRVSPRGRVPADGAVGVAFALASSATLLILARSAQGETHVLQILSGDILGTTQVEIFWMAGIFGATALLHYACWKEFLFVSYDPDMAATLGLRIRFWDGLLFFSLAACVALALRVSGAIVSFAFLIGPSVAALLVSRRFPVIIATAIILGALSAAAGLTLSFFEDLPSGPTIAACSLVPILPAMLGRWFVREA